MGDELALQHHGDLVPILVGKVLGFGLEIGIGDERILQRVVDVAEADRSTGAPAFQRRDEPGRVGLGYECGHLRCRLAAELGAAGQLVNRRRRFKARRAGINEDAVIGIEHDVIVGPRRACVARAGMSQAQEIVGDLSWCLGHRGRLPRYKRRAHRQRTPTSLAVDDVGIVIDKADERSAQRRHDRPRREVDDFVRPAALCARRSRFGHQEARGRREIDVASRPVDELGAGFQVEHPVPPVEDVHAIAGRV